MRIEIARVLREEIEGFDQAIQVAETGYVASVGDGIAHIHGIDKVMAGELLAFPYGISGIALNLDEDEVGAVILGEADEIKEGDEVRRTGRIMSVPVGQSLIGRVVDSLGQPIDGKGPIDTPDFLPVERIAPGVIDRLPVKEPLQTGIKAIDAMIPIGRGAARVDHWRPPDGQDGDRAGHNHQPEGPGRGVHLRGHRAEAQRFLNSLLA